LGFWDFEIWDFENWGFLKLNFLQRGVDHPETVLLLHGMGSCGEDWELQFPALTSHYRVLAPDARGHGHSPKPPGPYSISQMAEEVAALLDDLQIPSAHVVGLSMGGCIAQQLALSHPNRVRSLVLVNTFAKIRPAGLGGLRRFFQRMWAVQFGAMRDVGVPLLNALFPKPEQAELRRLGVERFLANNASKDVYRAVLRATVAFDSRRELHRIACPTLIVAGDRDLTVPLACKHELHRLIPNSQLTLIPDSGHATPIDQHERFNELLVGFFQRQKILAL
jgi:pimeloyl-ACP methyl ester carboxylesterase